MGKEAEFAFENEEIDSEDEFEIFERTKFDEAGNPMPFGTPKSQGEQPSRRVGVINQRRIEETKKPVPDMFSMFKEVTSKHEVEIKTISPALVKTFLDEGMNEEDMLEYLEGKVVENAKTIAEFLIRSMTKDNK